MKKIISTILIIFLLPYAAMAEVACDENSSNQVTAYSTAAPIKDDLVESEVFPKLVPIYVKSNEPITDELITPYEKSGLTLRLWARKTGERKKVSIDDELITPKFISKTGGISVLKKEHKSIITDNLAKTNLADKNFAEIKTKNNYDFTKAEIPVQMKIIKNLTTKNNIMEGDSILFKTVNEVTLNGYVLPKGTQVIGRVETVSESDKMGTPANIVVDNFYVKDNPNICFYGNISKTGANRSIWVYPLYQAGNILLYVAGFVFVPIHGGHAKLLTSDTYTVFYETH